MEETPPDTAPKTGLNILANYDFVECNGRRGKPLNFSGKEHTRGIFCHAPSTLLVRLPSRASTFPPWSASTVTNKPARNAEASVFRSR